MDFDLFLSPPRWDILQIIAKRPSSPVEIAQQLKTTVSYISQQLKLLDAAGLVLKNKTGEVEKGKPRTIFSIAEDLAYLVSLTRTVASKKLIRPTERQKAIINIWLLNSSSGEYIERFFSRIEEELGEIEAMAVDVSSSSMPKVFLVSESKTLRKKVDSILERGERKLIVSIISRAHLDLGNQNLSFVYSKQNFLQELKGGKKNE